MKVYNLKDYHRGWFIGNFDPALYHDETIEIGVLTHKKGEIWPKHYHKIMNETNVLLEGHMTICGREIFKDDIFVIAPGEIADPVFHENCRVLCIKAPSIPKDKYEVV